MIEIRPASKIPEYCNACDSKDTADPKNLAVSISEDANASVFTLCKMCRADLLDALSQEAEMVLVPKETYRQLNRARRKLNALECGGVDNWSFYDDALHQFYIDDEEESTDGES